MIFSKQIFEKHIFNVFSQNMFWNKLINLRTPFAKIEDMSEKQFWKHVFWTMFPSIMKQKCSGRMKQTCSGRTDPANKRLNNCLISWKHVWTSIALEIIPESLLKRFHDNSGNKTLPENNNWKNKPGLCHWKMSPGENVPERI